MVSARRASSRSSSAKAPSVKDVALTAGVSVGTVSNVINGRGTVGQDVRQRVNDAIRTLGYVPNPTAQALRRGVSPLVGVAVFDLTNPFFMEAAAGMERRLHEAGCVMSLASTHADPQSEATLLRALAGQAVRGILLTPADSDLEVAHELVRRGLPVVLFDSPDTPADMSAISIDDRAGATLAIEHLLGLGHRRIVFLNGPSNVRQARQRLLGVEDAVHHWTKRLNGSGEESVSLEVLEAEDFTARASRACMYDLLEKHTIPLIDPNSPSAQTETSSRQDPLPADFPTAIFCANDLLAFGAISVLKEAHIRIPADVSIVGFDDIALAAQLSVPLTTVRQPMEELGEEAADLLLRAATDRESPVVHRKFFPHLVVRKSTAPPTRR
ncbi:LacI family DNA-binding transcriptional regulator [Schaalia sp. ZJ405]|uniref:LacI family DNA-binding transcriptional regulator n=1 Tax=Schaalia sp. ZJ405 TaxID=2709403 RepID=UPI0013ECC22A|nr:LacI family DNA-binding transcriptional regulator [Schaalia sp. ZJ405]QPK81252.1 LacI family DNA-binding transcriptional regulator [Schaalia sp. ZJ405]